MRNVYPAGQVFVVFTEDAQGRRVAIGDQQYPSDPLSLGVVTRPVVDAKMVIAKTRGELLEVIRALRNLVGDLPEE